MNKHFTDITSTLAAFREAGFEFFPLRAGTKEPQHTGWRSRDYSDFDPAEWIAGGGNLGTRLKPNQLVLDIDPRNGGEESFERLCIDVGVDLDHAPRCRTGGGGWHYFLTKDAELIIGKNLKAYPGVDFSVGRQVVAPAAFTLPLVSATSSTRLVRQVQADAVARRTGGEAAQGASPRAHRRGWRAYARAARPRAVRSRRPRFRSGWSAPRRLGLIDGCGARRDQR